MRVKTFGAVVGVSAVLVAVPLTMVRTEQATGAGIPVAQAAPTTYYPGDPDYERQKRIQDEWERNLPTYTPPPSTVTVTPTTTTKPVPATKHESGGIPWWVWVLGTIFAIGGLLWWGTTLDDGSAARAALRDDDDDDDEDDDDDPDEPLLTYPPITPASAPEAIPYPEPTPSVPAAPAPSGGSLMERLGK